MLGVGAAVTVCQAPPQGFLEDQLERGWWAGSEPGLHSHTTSANLGKHALLKQHML